MSVSRAHSIVGSNPEGRPEHDFYPSPPDAVEDLLRVEEFKGLIWEPACGDGAMSKVLIAAGHKVFSTDIVDRGYGHGQNDFLKPFLIRTPIKNVITNPPFSLAQPFIEKSLGLVGDGGKVAMLLKTIFLEGTKRASFFAKTPPARVWVFSRRLKFGRNGEPAGSGMMSFSWFVWDKGFTGKPTIGWL